MNVLELVRENVKRLKSFSSAREDFEGQADILLDANESPYDSEYNRYPDPYQKELKQIIASEKNLDPSQIILGNGSDELIDLLVRTFCEPRKDIIRFITPSFGMYEVIADINDIQKEKVELTEHFALNVDMCLYNQTVNHKMLFLCSPNNPTGNSLDRKDLITVLDHWKGIVVVDEAYIEFSREDSLISKLDQYPNLVVLQTFSKAKGGAGLRLGMGFASSDLLQYVNKIKPPYNVNQHTQKMAKLILSQADIIQGHVEMIIRERGQLYSALVEINGILKVFESDANFLLVRCENHMALYVYLVNRGIIVRDRSKLLGCASCLRMTVGLPKENEKLIETIDSFYKKSLEE